MKSFMLQALEMINSYSLFQPACNKCRLQILLNGMNAGTDSKIEKQSLRSTLALYELTLCRVKERRMDKMSADTQVTHRKVAK
jgi:hypothetical protein